MNQLSFSIDYQK